MKKTLFAFILLAISYFLFAPASALAIDSGCCKLIQWDSANSIFKVQAFPAADSDKCLESCAKLSDCQNYYSANTPTDVTNKICVADSSGCCGITYFNPVDNLDYSLVYNANSTTECDHYASKFVSIKKKAFTQGFVANPSTNTCVAPRPVKPISTQLGCCKRVHWGELGLDTIEVFNISDLTECLNTCKDLSGFSSTRKCQNFYVAGATPDPVSKSCQSASSGCCQISFTPDVRSSESITKTLAYSANDKTDCSHYCFKRESCSVDSFNTNQAPNSDASLCKAVAAVTPPTTPTIAGGVNPKIISITNPLNSNSIPGLIGNVITWILKIIGAIALALFFWGGLQWLISGGNDKRVTAGKDTLFWASIGLICVFLSYIAVGFVLEMLGVI